MVAEQHRSMKRQLRYERRRRINAVLLKRPRTAALAMMKVQQVCEPKDNDAAGGRAIRLTGAVSRASDKTGAEKVQIGKSVE